MREKKNNAHKKKTNEAIFIVTTRAINAGEELCANYSETHNLALVKAGNDASKIEKMHLTQQIHNFMDSSLYEASN